MNDRVMQSLDDMRLFVRVLDGGSLSAAAAATGLSKSAVSKRLARLEGDLGARLLNRTTRRLSPTVAGAEFAEHARRILRDVEEAALRVARHGEAPSGLLRVNAPVTFGHRHVAPVVAEALSRWPSLEIELSLADRFVDVVAEGWDVVVRIATLVDSSLVARKLAPVDRLLCAAPTYLARHGTPRRPADLRNHDCIVYSHAVDRVDWTFVDEAGHVERVRVRGRLSIDNGDAARRVLLAGQGIALSPSFLVAEDLEAGRLVPLLPGWRNPFGAAYAVWPHNRSLTPKVRGFVDLLVTRLGPAPGWRAGPQQRG